MAKIQIQGQTIAQMTEKEHLDGTEQFVIQDAEGNRKARSSAIKEYCAPDLSGKVSGTGVTQMQVVTELPESPEDKTLYIVVPADAEPTL